MNGDMLKKLAGICDIGGTAAFCVVVEESGSTPRGMGSSMIVYPDGRTDGTIGGGISEHRVITRAVKMMESGGGSALHRESLSDSEAGLDGAVCGGSMAVYIEVIGRGRELVVFGAGHVGKAIARLGDMVGFGVTVWDEREEFVNDRNIPWGRKICCPLGEYFDNAPDFHDGTSVVIVTRGHSLDGEVVKLIEGRPAAYMGMIGSRKKIRIIRERLGKEGVPMAHLDRIYQPVGLPIKAETPEEIAVSVIAEIISVYRGADVAALRGSYGDLVSL